MAKKKPATKKSGPVNKTQRIKRRETIAQLRLEGRTFREIADEVGCSISTVHVDLRVIEHAWVSEAALSFATKAREKEGDLIRVRNTAWDAYYMSCTEERPCGDPRFLELARRCDENIVKLYRLDDAEAFMMNESAGGSGQESQQRPEAVEVVVDSKDQIAAIVNFDEFKKMARGA